MSKFVKKILLFLIIPILLLFFLEFLVREIPNNYSYKNKYLAKNSSNLEIFSLGSSHAIYAIDPMFFDKRGFNGAHVSQSLSYDFLIWEEYKSSMDNLKVLVLPISYFTLFSDLGDGSEAWRLKNYSLYYNFKSDQLKHNIEILNQKPLSIARMFVKMLVGRTNLTISELGVSNRYSQQQDLEVTGKSAALRHTKTNFTRLDKNIEYLSTILTYCDEKDIKVILITTPTTDYYWKNLNPKQLSLMYSTIEETIKDYPNAKYFDFLKDPSFIYADFRDADHLNPKGAEKFSIKLNSIINDFSSFSTM